MIECRMIPRVSIIIGLAKHSDIEVEQMYAKLEEITKSAKIAAGILFSSTMIKTAKSATSCPHVCVCVCVFLVFFLSLINN